MLSELKTLPVRRYLAQGLNLCLVVVSAYMLWKGASVLTNCESPMVVVLSGSMEPAFYRGDILFLYNRGRRAAIGDVVVYQIKGRDIPIVHRVIKHHDSTERQLILTKGDNNQADDVELYRRVSRIVPRAGMVTIWLNESLWMKYTLLGVLGVLMLIYQE